MLPEQLRARAAHFLASFVLGQGTSRERSYPASLNRVAEGILERNKDPRNRLQLANPPLLGQSRSTERCFAKFYMGSFRCSRSSPGGARLGCHRSMDQTSTTRSEESSITGAVLLKTNPETTCYVLQHENIEHTPIASTEAHMYTHIYIYTHIFIYIYTHIHTHTCTHTHRCTYRPICVYTHRST